MNLHIIMHEAFEAPGAIDLWASRNGHRTSYTRLHEGEVLPSSVEDMDFLIVMGGPQSPATTKDECPYFDAPAEISFIKRAIDANKQVLGICLGAQLIGEALGAPFERSPNREIGTFEVSLTHDAKSDPIFSSFPMRFEVGHWHADMPGLTPESKVLATSKGCPRQIVRYTPKVYGFQCHFEFTKESIEGMIENCGHELEENSPYIHSANSLRKQDYEGMNNLLFQFLDRLQQP